MNRSQPTLLFPSAGSPVSFRFRLILATKLVGSCLRSTLSLRSAAYLLSVLGLLSASVALATPETRVFIKVMQPGEPENNSPGTLNKVFFNDGDSFTVLEGPLKDTKTRLSGFNTLESFGPAHKWRDWDPFELYVVAKQATLNARRGSWHCTTDGKRDGYGRMLMHCQDLIDDDIRKGLAHAYSVDEKPAGAHELALQKEAQAEKRGLWAKGIPPFIVTSTHSADEGAGAETYNRLISTADGHTEKWKHQDDYKDCDWICHPTGACMLHVYFKNRFGASQAACLKH
jgi:endonuclease YncB( thermonuclease family)